MTIERTSVGTKVGTRVGTRVGSKDGSRAKDGNAGEYMWDDCFGAI